MLTPRGVEVLAAACAVYAGQGGSRAVAARELAVGTRLRAEGVPAELVAVAFGQAELRRHAQAKFALAERMFFTRAGLEQASSQAAAAHRAERFAGLARLADLCTGIGGDAQALVHAADGEAGTADREILLVDRDPLHLWMAAHNAALDAATDSAATDSAATDSAATDSAATDSAGFGGAGRGDGTSAVTSAGHAGAGISARVGTRLADVRDIDLVGFDGVFVDPARRAGDRRLGSSACEPPLPWCFALVDQVAAVAVKAAPGIDVAVVPSGWEIEFVADGRDLKEAVLFSPALASARRRATILRPVPSDGSAEPSKQAPAGPADGAGPVGAAGPERTVSLVGEPDAPDSDGRLGAPGGYLYDPSPAVTRAGLVGELARRLDAWQIDPMIAFLTSDDPVDTPFARLLRIDADLPFDVRRLGALLRTRGIGSLEIRRRGLAGDVDALRRRLLPRRRDLVPGGPAVTVMMTRLRDQPWALVCVPVSPPAAAPSPSPSPPASPSPLPSPSLPLPPSPPGWTEGSA
ncbi:class I SAM-dependent methyltransferase [Frankia sp. Ag45/Mut15]|uniref:Class I SAM-dependent methyltransferase n=1 Tax=Frankia umida TaxID=573489 RepID=A0ABT0JSG4_9ACTN|nr:class I SAM-dependent methyltransferase [Frankia umida]MCK9874502.1 class I SAM-dependent methyltransferase [Frankia umida]